MSNTAKVEAIKSRYRGIIAIKVTATNNGLKLAKELQKELNNDSNITDSILFELDSVCYMFFDSSSYNKLVVSQLFDCDLIKPLLSNGLTPRGLTNNAHGNRVSQGELQLTYYDTVESVFTNYFLEDLEDEMIHLRDGHRFSLKGAKDFNTLSDSIECCLNDTVFLSLLTSKSKGYLYSFITSLIEI